MLSVSGNNASRVFYVTNAAIVSISGLTVSAGLGDHDEGSGIDNNNSTLTVSNCNISGVQLPAAASATTTCSARRC